MQILYFGVHLLINRKKNISAIKIAEKDTFVLYYAVKELSNNETSK